MLAKGEIVSNFSLSDQHGDTVTLEDLVAARGLVVLFFYQRTFTPG